MRPELVLGVARMHALRRRLALHVGRLQRRSAGRSRTPFSLHAAPPCSIYAVNKIDQITIEELNVLDKLPHYCPVCAYHEVRRRPRGGSRAAKGSLRGGGGATGGKCVVRLHGTELMPEPACPTLGEHAPPTIAFILSLTAPLPCSGT